MKKCILCNLDYSKLENTIIEETDNFKIVPAVGSFVDGYLLIVSKRHVYSMVDLNDAEKKEYKKLIEKYRNKFNEIYGKYPIVFEHGTPIVHSKKKASSIVHAHTHIINYNFYDNEKIIDYMNFNKIRDINFINRRSNYITYIDHFGNCYVSYDFDSTSQLMRKLVAEELGLGDEYNWKSYMFMENIISTIDKFR